MANSITEDINLTECLLTENPNSRRCQSV